jgi:hypothetical protein
MTVHVCGVTFSDWVSLQFEGGWSDTFIFRIDSKACLPPFVFRPLLQRMAARMQTKRSSASLWVQVDGPDEWYAAEVRRSLKGLSLPFAVTQHETVPTHVEFSRPLWLGYDRSPRPPDHHEKSKLPPISPQEMRCLQALGRMIKGDEVEIASLAGLNVEDLLASLMKKKLVEHKIGQVIQKDKSEPVKMDPFPLWRPTTKGLSLALRSWDVPRGIEFTSRAEEHLSQIGSEHRRTSRLWLSWLKSAWPHAQIWAGWSEVRLPEKSVIPDALAWGRIQGYEALFWLEVGDGHKRRNKITDITTKRLNQAWELCERTGVRLVYAQLSTNWVHEATCWACIDLPKEVAVVMGNKRKFGKLPTVEWGRVTK